MIGPSHEKSPPCYQHDGDSKYRSNHKPVPGWTATPVVLQEKNGSYRYKWDTYCIIIARKTGQNPELIRIALENAAGQALKHAEPQLKEAVRRGYLHDVGPLETSGSVSRVFTSYQRQAEDTANLVNTVMLDSGKGLWH